MKTKKQIKEMIAKEKKLRKVMPARSAFGDDNWGNIDKEIITLEKCLAMSEVTIREKVGSRVEVLEDGGEDCIEDAIVRAYDWVVDDTEELVSDDDIEIFSPKK